MATGKNEEMAIEPQRQAALRSLLGDLPESYAERYAAIQKIRHAFHREMASAVEAPLNAHVAHKPQTKPEERKDLAGWINQQLRDIGLAVRCPKTGNPASLIVDWQYADDPEIRRFRFAIRSESGKSCHTAARRELPYLHLTEHAPRIEPFAKYYRRKPPDALRE
jgi:hypothetical protein